MKKAAITITAITCICFFANNTNAQSTTTTTTTTIGTMGRTTFGIQAGVNFYNINGKNTNGDKLNNKLKTGFEGGVNAEIPLAPDFYFQPGIMYNSKGAKVDVGGSNATYNLNYIDVPLNLVFKPGLPTGRVLLGFGPYVGYGIGGSVKNGGPVTDTKFKKNAGTDPSTRYFKPLDAGLNLLAGYQFMNNLSLQLNAQLGVVNTNAYGDGAKYRNTGFGISAGYRF